MKFSVVCLLFLYAFMGVVPAYSEYTDSAILRLNFDFENDRGKFSGESNISFFIEDINVAGEADYSMKVSYVPSDQGSERVTKRIKFSKEVSSATLSYDVKFKEGFEFKNGGKLHGLSGGNDYSGCEPVNSGGWSVRVMWHSDGSPFLYIYHQDRTNVCGEGYKGESRFTFDPEKWHRVELYVGLNSENGSSDGVAELYVNGNQLKKVEGLNFTGDQNVLIEQFNFSTFYGGNSPDWSPSKTTEANFKNFTVREGRTIIGSKGLACEILFDGIVNASGACCDDQCGSCGGSGCGYLPGGGERCCSTEIISSNIMCDVNGGYGAPCFVSPVQSCISVEECPWLSNIVSNNLLML